MRRRRVSTSLVRLGRTIRAHVFRTPVPEEVDEEFAFHVEMRIRQHLGEGMSLEEARAAAVQRFGDLEAVKQVCRRFGEQRERMMTRTTWMAELGQDLRLALRQLRRSPGFALAAVLTLGLGMGANTAVFSVVNGVLLSPLPFPESDRLVEVRTRYLPPSGFDIDRFPISVPELMDLREASRSFEVLGLYTTGNRTLAASGGEPVRVPAVFLDHAAFEALGVQPALGRWFTDEEDRTQPSIGLIGHDLWTTRFGGDPSIVGTTIETGGTPFLVTGVMPEVFAFPSARYQVFENYGLDPASPGNRGAHNSYGIGRLAPGVTMEQAVAEANVIHAGWAEQFPHNVAHFPIYEWLSDNLVGTDVRRALFILAGAVAVVLLIAAANVANLLLARGEGRLAEVAVRRSMGASGGRIVRQLLTEGLVLSVLGALAGLLIGELGLGALLRIHPEALPRAELIGLNGSVMAFTAAVTVLTALLFGLAPALDAARAPATTLGAGTTRNSGTRGPRRFRRALVASEVGLSLVVVLAAGLIGSSFRELTRVDPGVDVNSRLVFTLSASRARYAEPEDVVGLFESLRGRLTALPGVTSVSAVSHLPLSGALSRNDFVIDGRPPRSGDDPAWTAQFTSVLPGYFETMGIEATAGRLLVEADSRDSEPVVVVSQDVVDEYFDGANPVGERIALSQDSLRWARIVGVVPRTRTDALDSDVIPQVYLPHAQGLGADRWTARTMFLTVRTAVPPASLMAGARAAVREVDARLPVTDLRSMQQVFDASVARPKFMANLLGAFALIALALAAVGIYGVVSYSVSRRTREIGIRMALGARGGTVFGLVMREGATPAMAGVLFALPVTLAAAGILDGVLYQVSPRDPAVFAGLSAVLVALAVLSSWVPARRAAGLAPTEALKHD